MAGFDPRKWKDRAKSRHDRRVKRLSPADRLIESRQLNRDLDAVKGLEVLVDWCAFRRIGVDFTNKHPGGLYNPEEKVIYINSVQGPERQLYVLLHECGHLLIDDKSETTELRFKNGYYTDPEVKKKFIYRCTVLEEEFEAWHRGRKLATKLGIKINEELYDSLKGKFLKTYMLWALGDPKYKMGGPE